MTLADDWRRDEGWDERIVTVLRSLFVVSVAPLMLMVLVFGEERFPDWLVTGLYISTLVTLVMWSAWKWIPRISFEKQEDE